MVLRRLGIRGAVFVAAMAMIRGHSELLLTLNMAVDNTYIQQSTGDDGCRIQSSVTVS